MRLLTSRQSEHRTLRISALARLLVALVTCVTIFSPHCDVCDALPFARGSAPPIVHHHLPLAPDTCNGSCSCCILQGLPVASPELEARSTTPAVRPLEAAQLGIAPATTVFRPPRTGIWL